MLANNQFVDRDLHSWWKRDLRLGGVVIAKHSPLWLLPTLIFHMTFFCWTKLWDFGSIMVVDINSGQVMVLFNSFSPSPS